MPEELTSKGMRKHGLTWVFWIAFISYMTVTLVLSFAGLLMAIFHILLHVAAYMISLAEYLASLPTFVAILFEFFIPIPIIAVLAGLILIFIAIRFIGGTGSAILYLAINGFALLVSYLLGTTQTTTNTLLNLSNVTEISAIGLAFAIVTLIGVYYSYKWKIIGQPMIYIGFAVVSSITLFISVSTTSFIELLGYIIAFFFLSKSEIYEFSGPKIIEKIMPFLIVISIAIISLPIIYSAFIPK